MKPGEVNRSPLRWAGSKKKLLPALRRLAPQTFQRYVEPFCGSLCLFVSLKPSRALVGDINEELVHFYKQVKKTAKVVADLAHQLPNDAHTYYKVRSLLPLELAPEVRAARFLYLNRYCFNGVYRTNRQGAFNVARGLHTGSIPSVEELVAFSHLLKDVSVKRCDFSTLMQQSGQGDFIYLDPPYAGRDVRDRGEYGVGAFKAPDIDRLVSEVMTADANGAKVLISYADLPQIRKAFKGWRFSRLNVGRNVSGFSTGRAIVSELIIRNYS